jgi:superfamily II helicase
VAEIAALMTLSYARRVLIVTPLRALSAQAERSFRKTFAPLGFKRLLALRRQRPFGR